MSAQDRQLSARDEALAIAVKRLSGILEFDSGDVIAVADWVLTGTCDVAMSMSAQAAANYRTYGGDE